MIEVEKINKRGRNYTMSKPVVVAVANGVKPSSEEDLNAI